MFHNMLDKVSYLSYLYLRSLKWRTISKIVTVQNDWMTVKATLQGLKQYRIFTLTETDEKVTVSAYGVIVIYFLRPKHYDYTLEE